MFNLMPIFNHKLTNMENQNKDFWDLFNTPFFQNTFTPLNASFNAFKVDIKETDKNYELIAELPGVDKENIELDYQNNCLSIKATIKQDKSDESTDNYIHQERYYGTMQRSFYVGKIDKENAKANFDNGVLSLILPKLPDKDTKSKIDIE